MCYLHNQWYDISCATLYIWLYVSYAIIIELKILEMVPIYTSFLCKANLFLFNYFNFRNPLVTVHTACLKTVQL